MGYYVDTYSFGSTGNKTLLPNLGGATPYAVRVTAGARTNTSESKIIKTEGMTDGFYTACSSIAPSFSKQWPYTGESDYLFALYTSSTNKVLSGTFVSWGADELKINVDQANANYRVIVEYWF